MKDFIKEQKEVQEKTRNHLPIPLKIHKGHAPSKKPLVDAHGEEQMILYQRCSGGN